MKILMVCLGNICRSPLAEGLLRKKVNDARLPIEIDSAGTSAFHIGNEPDTRTQENAQVHGIDLSQLRARQFTTNDFKNFDCIYVMDRTNAFNALQLATNDFEKEKIKLILSELKDEKITEVPDPYFGGPQGFENVFQLLNRATDNILNDLKQQYA